MTIQVKPVYRKPEEGQGQPGRVLDKDDTQRLLIKARSSVLHMEAGYTTDNLLLSLTVECLAMREETIYVPPRRVPRRRSAGALHPLTSEAEVHLGPQRPSRLVDPCIGRETEAAVAGQVQMLGVGLVQQVVDTDAGGHCLIEAVGRIQ